MLVVSVSSVRNLCLCLFEHVCSNLNKIGLHLHEMVNVDLCKRKFSQ